MQTFRVVANQCLAATLVKVVFPQLFVWSRCAQNVIAGS